MTRIDVVRDLGGNIVTREHGRQLREMILTGLESAEKVTVDFGGVQITSVSFFDEALGQIALKHPGVKIDAAVVLDRIDPFDRQLVDDILASRRREAERKKSARKG